MRHFKADVSHRIKRRPSIFTARWFQVTFALGVIVIVGLLVGPSIAGWLRGDGPPPSRVAQPASPVARPAEPSRVDALRMESPLTAAAAPAAPAPTPAPAPAANGVPETAPTTPPAAKATAAPAPEPAPEKPAAVSTGPGVYRIQLGAFLDHRNADRLIERLRGEGLEAGNSLVDESQTLYRVLATPGDGEGYPALVQRLRGLGFAPELTDQGAIVSGPVALRTAVETSRRLRDQGIRVRLERQVSSGKFRVVRVGAYATAAEAERARAELVARGYEGIVVRDAR
jgi:translation initiation factor IF-2